MDSTWTVIYQYDPHADLSTAIIQPVKADSRLRGNDNAGARITRILGFILISLGFGGFFGPLIPALRLESAFAMSRVASYIHAQMNKSAKQTNPLPVAVPVVFDPLVAPDGSPITPVNRDFSLIIPKIGVNAPVIANVDPTKPAAYNAALLQGVAHASTSMLPDQNGTVYLFSHSTSEDWFVKDLNAVFYLLKDLKEGDTIVVYYQGKQYIYTIREKRIVNPSEVSYLVPQSGIKSLILETCWPPGSTTQRLLIMANLM